MCGCGVDVILRLTIGRQKLAQAAHQDGSPRTPARTKPALTAYNRPSPIEFPMPETGVLAEIIT